MHPSCRVCAVVVFLTAVTVVNADTPVGNLQPTLRPAASPRRNASCTWNARAPRVAGWR